MTNGNEFEIIISGDSKRLSSSLEDAEKRLKTFQQKGVQGSTTALMNLNRVVQDAPYGFIGIANNLDPLLESFGRLKMQTGSAGAALKAMAGSLAGPAGLGFALAGVSTAVTMLIQKYGSLGNAMHAIFNSTSEATNRILEFNKALSDANKKAGEEIARLNMLASVAKDVTRSMEERRTAAAALQAELKTYNVAMTQEAALNGLVAKETLKARDAIIAKARAVALSEKMSSVESGLIDIAQARNVALENLTNAQNDLNKAQERQNNVRGAIADVSAGMIGYERAVTKAKEALIGLGNQEYELLGKKRFLNSLLDTEDLKVPDPDGKTDVSGLSNKVGKSLLELFYDINEDAGKGWQKLIDTSEKWRNTYYDEWAKQITASDRRQQILDAFNRTNEAIQKGIVGIKPGGFLDQFGGQQIAGLEKRLKLEQMIHAMGGKATDTSFLSEETAKAQMLTWQFGDLIEKVQSIQPALELLSPAFNTLFDSMASGSMNAGEALRNMFAGILKQIAITAAKAAALAAVLSLITGGAAKGGMSFVSAFRGLAGGGGLGTPNFGAVSNGIKFEDVNFSGYLRGEDVFFSNQRAGNRISRLGG